MYYIYIFIIFMYDFCIFIYFVLLTFYFIDLVSDTGLSRWPRGLRRESAAAGLLRLRVRIPPGARMFVCCVLSGRGLCDGLITRPEESYRLWCV